MDFKRIIENGYGKLADKLPDTDKEYLKGFKYAMEMLGTFKDNIDDYIHNDGKTIADIEKEIAEITIDNAIDYLDCTHDEILVSLVDNSEVIDNG